MCFALNGRRTECVGYQKERETEKPRPFGMVRPRNDLLGFSRGHSQLLRGSIALGTLLKASRGFCLEWLFPGMKGMGL